ncbi:LPS O-antigen chain length determinant protein WzzB [Aeromonas hydrophila]|uniref:LPS O-antigen chain length determinant protein WzzB n=1 Tax=Aeromonas hydrophila TaxID=644 RepID=UPI0029DA2415|nr:Wzz/FepE/Etk N-terminal domain-containing protein [Aeromonas hydrophila]MDX7780098.1 Wzz/FepE/Etk N-terminal domain-containing protein [Aeromonas hydrophila]
MTSVSHPEREPSNDSVSLDLNAIVFVLWKNKIILIMAAVVSCVLGGIYAYTAAQVWTSQALIDQPTSREINHLRLVVNKLVNNNIEPKALASFEKEVIFKDFIKGFNSADNKVNFLIAEGIVDSSPNPQKNDSAQNQKAQLKKLIKTIDARALDKLSDEVTLSFSGDTSGDAKRWLEKYIAFIQAKQVEAKNNELYSIWQNRIKTLDAQYDSVVTDTLQRQKDEIIRTGYSLRISNAAGLDKPVENLNNRDVFYIELGSKALAEKLEVLRSMKDPEIMNPELGSLRLQINSLKSLDIKNVSFQSFSYLSSPDEPISRDKPRRPLIIILSTFLGGIFGAGVVLFRHSFRYRQRGV